MKEEDLTRRQIDVLAFFKETMRTSGSNCTKITGNMPNAKYILGRQYHAVDTFNRHTLSIAPPGTEANITGAWITELQFGGEGVAFLLNFPWPVAERVFQPLAGEYARQENGFLPYRTVIIMCDTASIEVRKSLDEAAAGGWRFGVLAEDGVIANY